MWLICRIVDSAGKQLGPEKFHESDEAHSLGTLFNHLDFQTAGSVTIKKVFLSESGKSGDVWTEADLTHPVSLVSQFKKPYLKFVVDVVTPISSVSGATTNAFDRLMAGSRRQSQLEHQRRMPQLPKPKNSSSPGFTKKDALHNHIIENILKKNNLLFKDKHQTDTDGVLMLKVLTNALWNIDEHHEKINHRATFSADVSGIPDVFVSCRGFNDNRKKKHAVRLERKTVENHAKNLFQILTIPSLYWNEGWESFHSDVEKLAKCLKFYTENLESENQSQQLRQSRLSLPSNAFDVLDIEKTLSPVAPVYKDLDTAIIEAFEYEVLEADAFAPTDKSKRYIFFKNLKLSKPVQLYRYHQSGSLGTLNFVWVVPPDSKQRSRSRMVSNIEKIKETIPTYHSRAMRKEFQEKFRCIAKAPPVVVAEIYRTLTSDATATPNPALTHRLRQFLNSDYDYLTDESVLIDLRQLNHGKSSKFDTFWQHLEQVLQEYCEAAADDRRHGDAYMPVAMSIPDLKKNAVDKMPLDVRSSASVPSDEYVRLQFLPINKHAHSSVKFTGRFNLKFKVQRRSLRSNHEDSHYTATLFKYLKNFSIKFRDHTILLSCDDKHNIQVGEPHHPVAALDRGRRVLGCEGVPIVALDHDFTKSKITPSVSLVIDIPNSPLETFYRGKVYIHVKDSIFSPSSPLVHGCELEDVLSASCPGGNIPPILAVYTDGGPDHRPTYGSVQLALLGVFKRYDLDMLIACRTAPGQSFINPVERIMSLLNLALQGVAIERSVSPEMEQQLKTCSSMADIRQLATKVQGLQSSYTDSMQSCIDLVVSRFNRLHLKDEPMYAMSSEVDDDDLDCLFSFVQLIDKELTRTMTTKKELILLKRYQQFMDTHAITHHYCFQLKKCGNELCEFCTPPRSPTQVFETLSFLPDPLLDSTGSKFKPFDEVYGQPNSEKDRPSLRTTPAEQSDQESRSTLVSNKARMTITCCECNKPRVVFSQYRLEEDVCKFVREMADFLLYSCGGPLYYELPSNWPDEVKHNVPIVRRTLTCSTPVEFAYYSCQKFANVCAHCGDSDCTVVTSLKNSFRTVLPTCDSCIKSGKEPVTRGKFKHPSSSSIVDTASKVPRTS